VPTAGIDDVLEQVDRHRRDLAWAVTAAASAYLLFMRRDVTSNVAGEHLRTTASCTRGAGPGLQEGPGNDWRCYVSWHLPGVNDATGQAIYQLDVNTNGRPVADGDGPDEVSGFVVQVRTGVHRTRSGSSTNVSICRPPH
jgi:ABC-2 type transport system permease protein